MSEFDRRPFVLALLVSLLLHWLILESPGWRVPDMPGLPEAGEKARLDARLSMPAQGVLPPSSSGIVLKPSVRPRPAAPRPPRTAAPAVQKALVSPPPAASSSSGEADLPEEVVPEVLVAAEKSTGEMASAATDEKPAVVKGEESRFALPRRGSVRFQVMRGERGLVVGQSVHHWNHDGKNYVLNSVTETTGLIALFKPVRAVWVSQGEIGPEGLIPHGFHAEKGGHRGDSASFDWSAMTLGLGSGPQRTVPLMPGSQDILSMFYQLGSMLPALLQATEVSAGKSFSLPVTTGRKLETYRFQWLGEESLSLNRLGEQRALHLRVEAGEQTIDIWLGKALRGLPLKIRYTDGKGDSFDQIADNIEFEEGTAP